MKELQLEVNRNFIKSDDTIDIGKTVIVMTPDITNWLYKVQVSKTQAIIGFPKFFTIGIGFLKESIRNTNWPYSLNTEVIYKHIKKNQGRSKDTTPERCLEAIRMIQKIAEKQKPIWKKLWESHI